MGTPRLKSLLSSTSTSAFILYSSSARSLSVPSPRSKPISAVAPLKSYRCAISLRAWFTALSTSCSPRWR
jgi:hypothetical protein